MSAKQGVAAVLSGFFVGAIMLVLSLSYTSLIFSGDASVYLPTGLVISLSSVVIVGFFTALFSGSRHLVVQLDDDTAPVFALIIAASLATLPADLPPESVLSALLIQVFFACLFTGLVLAVCGQLKLGNLVQFMPYSVMGGYFAAVGWLMITGTVIMLAGVGAASFTGESSLIHSDNLIRWLPALLVGAAIRFLASKFSTGLVLSVSLFVFIAGFYLIALAYGTGLQELEQKGFLIGPFNSLPDSLFNPTWSLDWSIFSWAMLSNSAGAIGSIALIALMSFILTISAIALASEKELDLNRELKVAGFANMIAAFSGGLLSLPSVSVSRLSLELNKTQTRLIGLAMVALAVAVFYFAMNVLALLPKMVLGALSIYIGLGFAVEWLFKGYQRFGALEYSVIPIILIVSITVGFLPSILVGIISAVILFAIKYSQVKVVRYESDAKSFRSALARDTQQNALLDERGTQIRFFQLQGFLFFGTAGNLYKQVMQSVRNENKGDRSTTQGADAVRYVILDFSHVSGVDSSAMLNIEKLGQRLKERQIGLLAAGVKPDVEQILGRNRSTSGSKSTLILLHHDMDTAMQWCEDKLLNDANQGLKMGRGLFERIADELDSDEDITVLEKYVTKHSAETGELIARIGDRSNDVFFLETCSASAYIVDPDGAEHRVSGAGKGAIFGEIGFLLGVPRTANVNIDSAGDFYSLTSESLRQMERENPQLAVIITHYLAKVVTERLANTTSALRSLM